MSHAIDELTRLQGQLDKAKATAVRNTRELEIAELTDSEYRAESDLVDEEWRRVDELEAAIEFEANREPDHVFFGEEWKRINDLDPKDFPHL